MYTHTSSSCNRNRTGLTILTFVSEASFPAPNPLWFFQLLQDSQYVILTNSPSQITLQNKKNLTFFTYAKCI